MDILKRGAKGDAVKRWQEFLQGQGYVVGAIDGDFGDKTVRATVAFQTKEGLTADGAVGPKTRAAARDLGFGIEAVQRTFDARTERLIATLLPKAQIWARRFLAAVRDTGIDARIISGTRTYAEQAAIYAQGRTKPGHIVTYAPPGYSNHNFGVAWDIGIFENGVYLDDSPLYNRAGVVGRNLGLDWGGDWKRIKDTPHFEVKTGLTLAQMRDRKAKGIPIL